VENPPLAYISKIERTTAACFFVHRERGGRGVGLLDVLIAIHHAALARELSHSQAMLFAAHHALGDLGPLKNSATLRAR